MNKPSSMSMWKAWAIMASSSSSSISYGGSAMTRSQLAGAVVPRKRWTGIWLMVTTRQFRAWLTVLALSSAMRAGGRADSTPTTVAAPRDAASTANPPEPEYRSSTALYSSQERVSNHAKIDSFLRSAVG